MPIRKIVIAFLFATVSSVYAADTPLLLPGKKTLFQRVLTTPG